MNARWYDPKSGTFDSRDSYLLSPSPSVQANRYTYGNADPLDMTDPTGHKSWWSWGGPILGPCDLLGGPAAQVACDVFTTAMSPEELGDGTCTGYYGVPCDVVEHPNPAPNPYPGSPNYRPLPPTYYLGSGATSLGGRGNPGGPSNHRGRPGPRTHPKKPLPPRDPCAHRHCTIPPGPKVGPTIALPISLTSVIGAVDVAEDLAAGAAGWVIDEATDIIDLLNPSRDPEPEPDHKSKPEPKKPSGTCALGGEGWVNYMPVDVGHGARATGVTACLNTAYLDTHSGSAADTRKVAPPGYEWARSYARWRKANPSRTVNACHLLADILTGSGEDLQNLSTCGRSANAITGSGMDSMQRFENIVKGLVDDHDTVLYQVTPRYKGNRTVPYEYEMSYTAWSASGALVGAAHDSVSNLLWTSTGWVNLGTVIDTRDGRDVPVGTVP
jgi:hypothetical protein